MGPFECDTNFARGSNEKDEDGWTALHWAMYHSRVEVVTVLLAAGANVEEEEIDVKTPLLRESANNSIPALQSLKRKYSEVRQKWSYSSTFCFRKESYKSDAFFGRRNSKATAVAWLGYDNLDGLRLHKFHSLMLFAWLLFPSILLLLRYSMSTVAANHKWRQ